MADSPVAQRLLRLIVPEVIRRPESVDLLGGRAIARVLDFVKGYLARQIELGQLRPHDVRASARAFIGMLLPQLGGKLLFPTIQDDGLTDDEHVEALVGIFLRGLEPLPTPAAGAGPVDPPQERAR
jgi:TetR/AcrR family transcriptional regulator